MSHFGHGGAFEVKSAPTPEPGAGEVLIRVAAAGVNRADLLQRAGKYPPPPGAPDWLGLEVSGVVVAVGQGVANHSEGDAVCALLPGGGYADHAIADAATTLPIPAGVTIIDAAGLMEAVCTVWPTLERANARACETLLVHGGSGGIGTTAIQIGKALGMTVWATARTRERAARCIALGADAAVAYADGPDAIAALGEADVIFDVVGGPRLSANVAQLATDGRLALIGLQGGRAGELDLGALLTKRATVFGTTLRSRPAAEKAAIVASVREHVWPWVPERVRPVIHATFPLADAAEAHAALESGEVFGKVLLTA